MSPIYDAFLKSKKGPITSLINAALSLQNDLKLNTRTNPTSIDGLEKFYSFKQSLRPYLSGINLNLFLVPRNGRSAYDILTSAQDFTINEIIRASLQAAVLLSWGSAFLSERDNVKFCL